MKLSQSSISKVRTYVGFAFKAGKCVMGIDNISKLSRTTLILYSNELSQNSFKKLCELTKRYQHNLVEIDEFKSISPREGCKALAIKDVNLADAINKQLTI